MHLKEAFGLLGVDIFASLDEIDSAYNQKMEMFNIRKYANPSRELIARFEGRVREITSARDLIKKLAMGIYEGREFRDFIIIYQRKLLDIINSYLGDNSFVNMLVRRIALEYKMHFESATSQEELVLILNDAKAAVDNALGQISQYNAYAR